MRWSTSLQIGIVPQQRGAGDVKELVTAGEIDRVEVRALNQRRKALVGQQGPQVGIAHEIDLA